MYKQNVVFNRFSRANLLRLQKEYLNKEVILLLLRLKTFKIVKSSNRDSTTSVISL